jgi:hypothetical protein
MAQPRVPGGPGERIELPCGESVTLADLDMGMREYDCACGATHAVVMDVHPLSRFFPEFLEEVLAETIETESGNRLGIQHLMGIVVEEFPEKVASADLSENPDVGYVMVWLTDFDARRLHEIVVELVVELMEHAISHADDETATTEFEEAMVSFDVSEFVEEYRARRDFTGPHDRPV